MININTGQNVAILAEQEIARLIAKGNKARDGDRKTNGNPPTPPAYVQRRRRLLKNKPKQMRLGI